MLKLHSQSNQDSMVLKEGQIHWSMKYKIDNLEIDPPKYAELFFDEDIKTIKWKKCNFSINYFETIELE